MSAVDSSPKRVAIATIGSLGDLYPVLAIAIELKRRGYAVTVAATPFYRSRVEGFGINFEPLRPDWDPTDSSLIRQCEEIKKGPEILYRRLVLPELRHTYDDLLRVAKNADFLIAGELVYAAPPVAEKLRLPWASAILSPVSFFSSFDPSVTVNLPSLIRLRKFGPSAYRTGLNLARLFVKHWSNPVRDLRREEGLRPECDPVFSDKFSPHLALALFSQALAAPQPDWPSQTVQTGFIFFDNEAKQVDPQLSAFLAAGDAPIVFTQGSTAVHNPGDFYRISVAVANRLGKRAILIGCKQAPEPASPDVLVLPYAPYSQIFPLAAINVHQGGSGTTGEAMRSGRPMLIVPYGWDQPDNAHRIQKLGAGLHLPRRNFSVDTAARALSELLTNARFANCAGQFKTQLAAENGLQAACRAIESALPNQ